MAFILVSCNHRNPIAEYPIQSENCGDGKLTLFDDSTYTKIWCDSEQTGSWYFKSVKDSILCLDKELAWDETLDMTEYYFAQNGQLFGLENREITEKFGWYFTKDKPKWGVYNKGQGNYSEERFHIKSSTDLPIMDYILVDDSGQMNVTLKGYYFLEPQLDETPGGHLVIAKTFLAISQE